jgi:flagellar biosynthesis/type III secretory pathway protein FliH
MGRIVKRGSPPATEVATCAPAAVDAVAWVAQARAEAKAAAVVLARKMAEKIVGHAVAVDAAVLRDIVASALAAVKPSSASLALRVHPDDLAALAAARPAWLRELGVQAEVALVADPAVGRAGCIVETPGGRIDARLDTQLDALERALRGAVAGRT